MEFQKRGLPHAYVLVILKHKSKLLTPEAYDRMVCVELPDRNKNPYLFNLVVKHMMHGPCGSLNPKNVCMRNGKCKNYYEDFSDFTTHGKGSYPIYRRQNDGHMVMVRGHLVDNRWVIPYNPVLLVEFDCHFNVEICCDIRVMKYLYKYVYKGHDKIAFQITPEREGQGNDEIRNFQTARWVSPVEVVWRLYGFPLNGMYPSVIQLPIHLPNFHRIRFDDAADIETISQDDKFKKTMLIEFFHMNSID
ncbi:hypothetical protein LIER_34827 [Lithospermum erythrorhizon]|uniref:Uncharacterized protein n=1 Tax=Lithospermum erythrorhizon TaxID=34254 RepID=A0AAV3S1C8_LITER